MTDNNGNTQVPGDGGKVREVVRIAEACADRLNMYERENGMIAGDDIDSIQKELSIPHRDELNKWPEIKSVPVPGHGHYYIISPDVVVWRELSAQDGYGWRVAVNDDNRGVSP